ncbi:DUF4435 domain-containing protein [Pantoea sp. FN0302]|uniref:DUF4435 domain-containing protein n=1 Tax=Pantoea sp. FN0302 TaxID=3418558 RepID=UPI003CFAE45B
MDELNHSLEAENILNLFYQSDYIVYVEGPDDICFWEKVLKETTDLTFEVQDVGGSTRLFSYMDSIINDDLKVIVACDSDLTLFDSNQKKHPRILRTYGYAIENTYIDQASIKLIIKNIAKLKSQQAESLKIMEWLTDIDQKTRKLVQLDIFNQKHRCGISVVGDNATRFMKNSASCYLCEEKIESFINQIKPNLVGYDDAAIENEINSHGLKHFLWLRGHFFFSAAAKLISIQAARFGKKPSISTESLYSNFITIFESKFNATHREYEYYHSITNNIQL